MRAPFDKTVTLYDGPGTATPGFPRVVGMACRLVSDLFFLDQYTPLDQALGYFTCEAAVPQAAAVTDLGGGVYTYNFTVADRAEFAAFPGVIFVVVRVELCTWQSPGAPYWRAHVVQEEPEPTVCSDAYADEYILTLDGDPTEFHVLRTGTTTWSGDGWTLEAETTLIDPMTCTSQWVASNGINTWSPIWNGVSTITDPIPQLPSGILTITAV